MRAFLAQVSVFNGRFYRHRQFTVKASNIRIAVQKAAAQYRTLVPIRSKVEGLVVNVTALKGCKPIIEDVEQS